MESVWGYSRRCHRSQVLFPPGSEVYHTTLPHYFLSGWRLLLPLGACNLQLNVPHVLHAGLQVSPVIMHLAGNLYPSSTVLKFSSFEQIYQCIPHNKRYTLVLENISLYLVQQKGVLLFSFFPISFLHPMLAPYFYFWTWLSSLHCFCTKATYSETSNWYLVG
jgi:hypothetical protein